MKPRSSFTRSLLVKPFSLLYDRLGGGTLINMTVDGMVLRASLICPSMLSITGLEAHSHNRYYEGACTARMEGTMEAIVEALCSVP